MNKNTEEYKILIADDDEIVAMLIEQILVQAGYSVDIVENSDKLIQKCLKNAYDLVLLDYHMPPQDGISAINEIKDHIDIGYIIITSKKDKILEEKSSKAGALGFIYKDELKEDSLLATVRHGVSVSKTIQYLSTTKDETKSIYTAIGILSERYKLSVDTAYESLRRHVRSERIKTIDFARLLIEENNHEFEKKREKSHIFSKINKLFVD